MSTLWTPSGEHPVGRDRRGQPAGPEGAPPGAPPAGGGSQAAGLRKGALRGVTTPRAARQEIGRTAPSPEDAEHLDELRRQLASAPAEVVVANHCFRALRARRGLPVAVASPAGAGAAGHRRLRCRRRGSGRAPRGDRRHPARRVGPDPAGLRADLRGATSRGRRRVDVRRGLPGGGRRRILTCA